MLNASILSWICELLWCTFYWPTKKKGEKEKDCKSSAHSKVFSKRREHISPVSAALHWDPLIFRIDLNVPPKKDQANSFVNYLTPRSSTAGFIGDFQKRHKENCHLCPKAVEHTSYGYQGRQLTIFFIKYGENIFFKRNNKFISLL